MTLKEPRTLEPRSAAPVAAAADGNRDGGPRARGMYEICRL